MHDTNVILNFQQELFHRMLCLDVSKMEIKEYFEYELASVPRSLSDSSQLRKGPVFLFECLLLPERDFVTF